HRPGQGCGSSFLLISGLCITEKERAFSRPPSASAGRGISRPSGSYVTPGPGVIVTERGVEQHSGLPAEMSSLVGRRPQIAAVLDSLRAARVVTLTGPGGCGKTRLALRAATLAADGLEAGGRGDERGP